MPNEMQMNPDYQLVMSFLQKIRPGDMDEESAQQLMIIGQRIQAGGVLSDQEREMFQSVVGATDRFPVEQMDTFPQGTNPDIMKQQMAPAQGMAPAQDMAPAPQGNVMSLDDAIAAGLVNPTRPQARPTAPMQSMRPPPRPRNLGGR